MTVKQKNAGAPWLYDETTGDIVGIKDPDGSELLLQRIPHTGSFFDVSDQTAVANTATAVECDTTDFSRGISVVELSKFTVSRKATYNFQFSAQLLNADTADREVSIWLRKNGVDLVNSCTDITVPSKHGSDLGAAVAAWNFFLDMEAGQYLQLMWSTPAALVTIEYGGTRTSPVRPAVPSVIVTMNEIDGSYLV